MLPLIPTIALAFVSFIASAFVILRIVIPILPPHPLSRRVPPSEFGLPNFKSLSPADKSHIWLACCDLVALIIFVWQAASEYTGGPSDFAIAQDPASAVRLWLATTLRQSCLLIVASMTLLHVRLGRPVSFGGKHWMIWAPTLVLAATSTALAGVFAGTDVASFFVGLVAYSGTLAVMSSVAFGCLVGTLLVIKRNLAALNEMRDPWPPAHSDKPRPSFATEDVDALKDGSSWITSRASSRRESISAFSFSTHHTHQTHHSAKPSNGSIRLHPGAMASNPSIPPKSSFWFNPATPYSNGRESPVPPVPPLPSPYRPSTAPSTGTLLDPAFHDEDPFRRQAPRTGSQSSWLSEHFSEQATLSAWSFPTTRPSTPAAYPSTPDLHPSLLPSTAFSGRPMTPAMVSTDVLGGYGYSPEAAQAEKGADTSLPSGEVDVSIWRGVGWFVTIWIPMGLALPYYAMVIPNQPFNSTIASILLVLSVTMSSPLLALNILLRSPLPIPTGLFDSYSEPPSAVMRAPTPASLPSFTHEYKRSGSVTVVEGRRSGDVWIANGDAIDGRSKVGRAIGMLSAKPKLSVLPPDGKALNDELLTPPLPIQTNDNMPSVPQTPQSQFSAELGRHGRMRKDSRASSQNDSADESAAFATQIMIAQRHYSALATTVILPPSPERRASQDVAATGVDPVSIDAETRRSSSHLRARSISSIAGPPISPPPSSPLPPTPPSVKERKAAQARLTHRKSYSSGFSFGAIDTTAEIDALSAGVLPLLLPGLKVGNDVRISKEWRISPSGTASKSGTRNGRKDKQDIPRDLTGVTSDFSSPDMHSTPAERRAAARARKTSGHKRHHFSLPSLSLGKDGIHALSTWRNDLNRALDTKISATVNDVNRRNTVIWGGEFGADSQAPLKAVHEEDELDREAGAGKRVESLLNTPSDVPENIHSNRNSLATLITALDQELRMPPPSAASEVTLFDFNPNDTSGPLAESTPHESHRNHHRFTGHNEVPPPVPKLPKATRRSSIVYIKSDENTATTSTKTTRPSTSPRTLADRVRPLIPKSRSSRVQAKSSSPTNSEHSPAGSGGLRPLSLLQHRDINSAGNDLTRSDTRPLTPGKTKKKNLIIKAKVLDENVPQPSQGSKKGLKPLKLTRSETTRERAALREREVLPDVVIRPPSQYSGYVDGFR
ncbi:hypothetical protein K474DRAFT_499719 [Panus rudis PR-1116 ss-1]|nr:hypothetical protein K474DRAFT_499719 [Panus rudis PR-1116 ss-1]